MLLFTADRSDEDRPSSLGLDRVTSTSVIRFRPTSSDDGVTWACEAEHPALDSAPLRASVLLSVLRKCYFYLYRPPAFCTAAGAAEAIIVI